MIYIETASTYKIVKGDEYYACPILSVGRRGVDVYGKCRLRMVVKHKMEGLNGLEDFVGCGR